MTRDEAKRALYNQARQAIPLPIRDHLYCDREPDRERESAALARTLQRTDGPPSREVRRMVVAFLVLGLVTLAGAAVIGELARLRDDVRATRRATEARCR